MCIRIRKLGSCLRVDGKHVRVDCGEGRTSMREVHVSSYMPRVVREYTRQNPRAMFAELALLCLSAQRNPPAVESAARLRVDDRMPCCGRACSPPATCAEPSAGTGRRRGTLCALSAAGGMRGSADGWWNWRGQSLEAEPLAAGSQAGRDDRCRAAQAGRRRSWRRPPAAAQG